MSPTFSNQPIPPEAPATEAPATEPSADGGAPSPAPHTAPPRPEQRDDTVLRRFCASTDGESVRRSLREHFDLSLSAPFLAWAQTCFRALGREPTVGELRLLSAMSREGEADPRRTVVSRLYTDDGELADTWATMMDRHAALYAHGAIPRAPHEKSQALAAPPCSLARALSLSGDYRRALRRSDSCGRRTLAVSTVCIPPEELPDALAAGYSVTSRFLLDGVGERLLCRRRGPALCEEGERPGDLLLLISHMPAAAAEKLVQEERVKKQPQLSAIRALRDVSLLEGVLSICHAAELHAGRAVLSEEEAAPRGVLPVQVLTSPRHVTVEDGKWPEADYLLRVSVKNVRLLSSTLKRLGVSAVVLGQVQANERTVIRIPDRDASREMTCVALPGHVLLSAAAVTGHRHQPENRPSPEGYTLTRPCAALLPSPRPAENGLSPAGRELITLTSAERPLLHLPDDRMVTHTVLAHVFDAPSAYRAANEAIHAALRPLAEAGVPKESVRLSLTVTASVEGCRPHAATVPLLCGLFRGLEQADVDTEATCLRFTSEPDSPPVTLVITGWGNAPAALQADPTQWKAGGTLPAACRVLLPVLRPTYESCVRAVADALLGLGAKECAVCPVAVRTGEDRGHFLDPQSVRSLLTRLSSAEMIVLAMAEADARLLLSNEELSDALQKKTAEGGRVLILGKACLPAAEADLLPPPLKAPLAALPSPRLLTVTYAHPQLPSVRRLPRANVLCSSAELAEDTPPLLHLHTAHGDVPDGFVGCEGHALGLLNGLDTAVASLLLRGAVIPAASTDSLT